MSEFLGMSFNCVYVDDFQKALDFYGRYLDFQKHYDISEKSCWGMAGKVGMYIEGGMKRRENDPDSVRTSVVYMISDAHALFRQLISDGVKVHQTEPMDMGQGFWFQFTDPAGNILEVLAGK